MVQKNWKMSFLLEFHDFVVLFYPVLAIITPRKIDFVALFIVLLFVYVNCYITCAIDTQW